MNFKKYKAPDAVPLARRDWPNKKITKAPIWCSVDLRDGNQALEAPMTLEKKLILYKHLLALGFREIEVAFPAASEIEFDFVRYLIEQNLIPDDVTIQVLTQARPEIIQRTMDAVRGAPRVILHLYNSTSYVQRAVVFRKNKKELLDFSVQGARMLAEAVLRERETSDTRFRFEFSPENFSRTEPEYAVEICDAIVETWLPYVDAAWGADDGGREAKRSDGGSDTGSDAAASPDDLTKAAPDADDRHDAPGAMEKKIIINLPNTMETGDANYYADLVEYFIKHTKYRDSILVSLHPHNDRGQAVAATQLALMAGGDRVEGTLFGNGERTGNVDLVTIALNLFSHGIDPGLDFSHINESVRIFELCTGMNLSPRHPYAGSLVYTAFSGSHQDAISKSMAHRRDDDGETWLVPYLPIDPRDIGRDFAPVIRINSQSGSGGVNWIMERYFGYQLPRDFQRAFSRDVKRESEALDQSLQPDVILDLFKELYLDLQKPLRLVSFKETTLTEKRVRVQAEVQCDDSLLQIDSEGAGVLEALNHGLSSALGIEFTIAEFQQHTITKSPNSRAIAYVTLEAPTPLAGKGQGDPVHHQFYGAGSSSNLTKAALRALVSAFNRAYDAKAWSLPEND